MCVGFVTAADFAVVRLVTGVDVRVLLPVTAVGEFSVTAVELALEGFLSCVSPLVNLQILRSSEHFSTSRERTREGLFSRMNSDVIYQFVLRFESLSFPWTFLPKTDVGALLRSPDMLHRDVVDQFVHCAVSFRAGLFWTLLLVNPFAD